jgi:hypothetical protein
MQGPRMQGTMPHFARPGDAWRIVVERRQGRLGKGVQPLPAPAPRQAGDFDRILPERHA